MQSTEMLPEHGPRLLFVFILLVFFGCTGTDPREDRKHVAAGIEERTGFSLGPEGQPGERSIPEDVSLDDGLSEDEAILLSLWNNAAFHEVITELGFSRADLVQAGLLSNPVLSVLFPIGPKQLEFAVTFPLEALWLMPRRVSVAKLQHERVGKLLMQEGVDLVRDVRIAYGNLLLARQREELASQAKDLRRHIAELVEHRYTSGAISQLEASTAKIDALRAEQEAAHWRRESDVAREELKNLLGLHDGKARLTLETTADARPVSLDASPASYIERALAARPDLRAAELAIEAGEEQSGLARWDWLRLSAIADVNEEGKSGFEIGPGLDVEIPLFDWNQGGMARAAARLQRALRHYFTVRDQIVLEVGKSHARFLQARENLRKSREEILPALEEAARLAETAYQEGSTSYLFVLETTRRLVEERGRDAELEAAVSYARAELERSIGQRLP
jgi:cobalt-zinc-cadmium efflux system outer membrane protein